MDPLFVQDNSPDTCGQQNAIGGRLPLRSRWRHFFITTVLYHIADVTSPCMYLWCHQNLPRWIKLVEFPMDPRRYPHMSFLSPIRKSWEVWSFRGVPPLTPRETPWNLGKSYTQPTQSILREDSMAGTWCKEKAFKKKKNNSLNLWRHNLPTSLDWLHLNLNCLTPWCMLWLNSHAWWLDKSSKYPKILLRGQNLWYHFG